MPRIVNISLVVKRLKALVLRAFRVRNIRFVRATQIRQLIQVSGSITVQSFYEAIVSAAPISEGVSGSITVSSIYEQPQVVDVDIFESVKGIIQVQGIYEQPSVDKKVIQLRVFLVPTGIYGAAVEDITGDILTNYTGSVQIVGEINHSVDDI